MKTSDILKLSLIEKVKNTLFDFIKAEEKKEK
jgi:hypothetical protein